ncbi:MAG: transketolase family protein [Candidatus Methanomethylophilaceae archaeon]|nr:transketolase family protein [Candidatus Methanomethylophilaceae archaeon]MBQ7979241.1 transketolase family protein [Candidatus Methanomethylophilaceae archaeon]MBQ9689004.1 transketolase family protein [Candidatus Methanomethylophilaceae archaeon]
MTEKLAQRNYYGKALAELAKEDPKVVVMDADLAGSTKTSDFQKVCPERFVEVGIAESNMIGIAAGLAASGKTVFASTFGVFATGRCWEQIRLAVAYPKLNVKIVATHCGISVGEDGASHQALEDIAIMRALPNMVVVAPADAYEAFAATKALAKYNGPAYMRMGRADFPTILEPDMEFQIGKASVLREGTDVTIVGCGQMVSFCMDAAETLQAEGISAEVINMSTIKPLDTETLIASVSKTGCCVTAEEHSIIGGLGSAVAEALCDSTCVPLERVGTKDTFGESGKPADLMVKYGLTADDIVAAAKKSVSRK